MWCHVTSDELARLAVICPLIYYLSAFQVYVGFPPFYGSLFSIPVVKARRHDQDVARSTFYALRPHLALMAIMVVGSLTGLPIVTFVLGVVAVACGLWLRALLFRASGGPVDWARFGLTKYWPMFWFDLWALLNLVLWSWIVLVAGAAQD